MEKQQHGIKPTKNPGIKNNNNTQELLQIKILCEKMSFQTSFERMVRGAMTKSERGRISGL